jgi:hypothetical protein
VLLVTFWNTLRVAGIIAVGAVGVALAATGHRNMGALLLLAALAGAFFTGRAILGDPRGVGHLPEGVSAADVKAHRQLHGGSISDALRGSSRGKE